MISDGEASYPGTQVTALVSLFSKIRKYGCRTCARCYFIQGSSDKVIPPNFSRICKALKAQIIVKSENNFAVAFKSDFSRFARQAKSSIASTASIANRT